MRILVIGSGGREHALVWKVAQSPLVDKVYAAPGNDAMAELAEPVEVNGNSIEAMADWAEKNRIDLTIVGPEVYLTLGIADLFSRRGLAVFGPSRGAARLEGSKVFAKEMMSRFGIPTADFRVFDDPAKAIAYIHSRSGPIVVKADGLAAGKGVTVAETAAEAEEAVGKLMVEKIYGDAGNRVVLEEKLSGEEVSLLAITDGETVIPLLPAQDHKRVFEGDRGPNTGGMGAYAPASVLTPELLDAVRKDILEPIIKGMTEMGHPYSGILYTGLMITESGPKVVEFNVRFGDPEAQAIIPLLRSDLVEICLATVKKRLKETEIQWADKVAACVVLASAGYPASYKVDMKITGLDKIRDMENLLVFHAGTKLVNGVWRTAGGRVLNLVGIDSDLAGALQKAYRAAEKICFPGRQFRRDIGWRELTRSARTSSLVTRRS